MTVFFWNTIQRYFIFIVKLLRSFVKINEILEIVLRKDVYEKSTIALSLKNLTKKVKIAEHKILGLSDARRKPIHAKMKHFFIYLSLKV